MSDNWIVQNLENALKTWNEKLAEIWQLFVPCFKCVLEVLDDPVITHIHSSFPANRGRPK